MRKFRFHPEDHCALSLGKFGRQPFACSGPSVWQLWRTIACLSLPAAQKVPLFFRKVQDCAGAGHERPSRVKCPEHCQDQRNFWPIVQGNCRQRPVEDRETCVVAQLRLDHTSQRRCWCWEHRTKCRKVQSHHFLVEQSREKVDNVLVGRGFLPSPLQVKLRHYLVPKNTTSRRTDGQ